jgi:dTDP-L-rhamnose 4-epimerase
MRDPILMKQGEFDPYCPHCNTKLRLTPTDEQALINPLSFYGITKYMQEASILLFAKQQGINAFALRYQNVYGPGQSLKNPYTGILAVFSNLARANANINVFEDGLESRDFVYIDDVIDATIKSIHYDKSFIGPLNVGSGKSSSVIDIAKKIKSYFNSHSVIEVSGDYRQGDIRHNIADISSIKSLLNFSPLVSIEDGLKRFLEWAASQSEEAVISYEQSIKELEQKNLIIKTR